MKTTQEAFDDLIESIKGYPALMESTLKAMMLFEGREAIYKAYAAGLGKPSLTAEEKKQALFNEVLDKGAGNND